MKKKDYKNSQEEIPTPEIPIPKVEESKSGAKIVDSSNKIKAKEGKLTPIEEKDRQIKSLTDLAKQTQADFINYKNRIDRERVEQMKFAGKTVLMKMLNIADNFELSLKHTDNHDEFVKGVEFIFGQFFQVLEEEGIKRIKVGDKFDPYQHEALLSEESDKETNTILETIQNGYTLHDKVVRNAKVKVAK